MRDWVRWSVAVAAALVLSLPVPGAAKALPHRSAPILATPPAADFFTLSPCRLFDSRTGTPLVSGTAVTVPIAGVCGVPSTGGPNPPVSVALNLTVISPSSAGALSAYPTGSGANLGTLDFRASQTRANNAVVELGGASGTIDVLLTTPAFPTTGTTQLAIDVVGYFEIDQALPQPDAATVLEDAAATTIDVLANDTAGMTGKLVAAVTQPANGTVVITNAGADLTYQPNANYCNTAPTVDTFTYKVMPGGLSATVSVSVTCVNDPPSFLKGTDQSVNENAGAQTVTGWATAISPGPANESGQTVQFNVTGNTNPGLFAAGPAISPTGDLSYTPASDTAGTATITITLQDNGGTANGGVDTSAPQTFSISVVAVNQAPSFTKGPDVTVLEDAGAQTVNPWATAISPGPANESGQTVHFNVTGNTNPGLFSAGPAISAAGVLTFTPAANANGTAAITITLQDDGGTANGGQDTSAPQTFNINVTAVNDPPSFTKGADQTVLEDAGPQTVNGWATAISAGPPDESGQTLTFNVTGNTNPGLFSAGPAISAAGVLTYTPAANANGTATITITLQDNGGTANGGVDTSAAQSFVINVTAVNDAPSFVKGPDQSVGDNLPATANPWATSVSAGPPDESGQILTFQVTGNTNPGIFAVGPAVSASGVLTFTPAIVPVGTSSATITLVLKDNGGTANGGADTSAPQSFTIAITHVNIPPALVPSPKETFDTVGNTELEFAAAPTLSTPEIFVAGNLVANFTDSDGPSPLSATAVSAGPTTNGGTVDIATNGEFRFHPKAGDTAASDSFSYTVTDGAAPVTRTVTVNLKQRVWYVKNDAGAGGLGRASDPFDTLVEAQTASLTGDYIFVYGGDLTTTGQAAGITLKASQKLYGEAYGLPISDTINGTLNPILVAANLANRPKIDNTAAGGNAVSVTNVSGVEVRGLSLAANTNAVKLTTSGSGGGGVTVTDDVITGSGAQGIRLQLDGSGASTATIQNNTITSTGNGIDSSTTASPLQLVVDHNTNILSGASGIVIASSSTGSTTIKSFAGNSIHQNTVGTGISVTSATFDADLVTPGFQTVDGGSTQVGISGNGVGGSGIVLGNVAGSLNFVSLAIYADGGAGLSVSGTGAFNGAVPSGMSLSAGLNTGPIEAIGGPAVSLSSLSANLQLSSIKSTNSTTTGVSLVSMTDYISPSSPAIFTAGLGSAISNATGTDFNIDGGAATVTYAGTITDTTGRLVSITNTTGDTKTFSDTISDTGSGTGQGIFLNGNSGATISFTGTLTLSTGSNDAFTATGGGTVTATDTGSTIVTTTGTAVNVANTTIGASGLKFKSISAGTATSGPASGIVLNNTGASGSLTVNGGGGAGTGGTIQKTTSDGVSLTSTLSPSFTGLAIKNTSGSGVKGTTVTNFSFVNGSIDSSGAGGGTDTSNIAFDTGVTGTENNISGTVTITGNSLTNALWHGVDIQNFSGTLSSINVSGNTITSPATTTSSKGSGIRLQAIGSATTAASVTTATLSNNVISNFPSGAGILAQGGNANSSGPSGTFGTPGTGNVISISSNQVKGQSSAVPLGTSAIIAAVSGKGQGNFDISNNGTVANPLTNMAGTAILCGGNGLTTSTFNVSNNVIVANNTVASNGVGGGTGVTFGTSDTPDMTWTITNNNISATDGNGILAVARGATGTLKVKIQNNTVAAPLSGVRPGIRIDAGNASSVNDSVCLNISGNTSAGSGGVQGIGLRKQGTVSTTNAFGVNGMAATSSPGVETYVNGLNPAGNGTLLLSATSGFSNCSLP